MADTDLEADGTMIGDVVLARTGGDFVQVTPQEISFMDVSPRQVVGVSAALVHRKAMTTPSGEKRGDSAEGSGAAARHAPASSRPEIQKQARDIVMASSPPRSP